MIPAWLAGPLAAPSSLLLMKLRLAVLVLVGHCPLGAVPRLSWRSRAISWGSWGTHSDQLL